MWQDLKNIYHLLQAVVANLYFGFPARNITVIGVTGTDGKTTTTHAIYHILTAAGKKAALISSVEAIIDGKTFDTGFHVSTPSTFPLQRYIKKVVASDAKYLVLEVTSHALDQYRIWGIPFRIGVLTNITSEHLDYHKTYEKYLLAKCRLLQNAEIAIINKDDVSFMKVEKILSVKKKKIITYSLHQEADVSGSNVQFQLPMPGDFNKANFLAAIAAARALGIPETISITAAKTFHLPRGRMDVVYEKDYTIIIDFAHTPNGIAQSLGAIREQYGKKSNIIHIFGSAGKRDKRKRPAMGKHAAEFANTIILTSEDPRDEDPQAINKDIASGIDRAGVKVEEIIDRQEAIRFAIASAKKGDVIVITGKGHEESMNFGHGEEPWSDYSAVEKALAE